MLALGSTVVEGELHEAIAAGQVIALGMRPQGR
jgi:hypothetical protein